jgi:hypothetical protein
MGAGAGHGSARRAVRAVIGTRRAPMTRRIPTGPAGSGVLLCVLLFAPGPISGQDGAGELFGQCAASAGTAPSAEAVLRALCAQSALAAHSLHGGFGLLVAAGGAHPASPSTAGSRIEGSPRVVVDGGLNVASFHHADLSRAGPDPREARSTLVAGRLTGSVGIWDGFSLAPTVGGVGSLDAVGTLRLARTPSGEGFGGTVTSLGLGARLGIFRESFSLPGVTLTALHHRPGTVRYGSLEGTGRRVELDPRITSTRLEVGKDLLAMGVTGGVGWDRISGRGRVAVRSGEAEAASGDVDLRQSRRYLFAGVNYTWLVAQVSGELAWASGRSPTGEVDPVPGVDAEGGGLQGSVTFRIRY